MIDLYVKISQIYKSHKRRYTFFLKKKKKLDVNICQIYLHRNACNNY